MNAAVPMTYGIRVAGHLDDHWCPWFGGLALSRDSDGTSTLTVTVADQAQLHGILAGLRDVGATLLDLHAAASAPSAATESPSATGSGRQ